MNLMGGFIRWVKSFWREPTPRYMLVWDRTNESEYVIDLWEKDDGREEN